MVSISEFKQAFASGRTSDRSKERGRQVEAALLRLKTAVARAGGANGTSGGFQAALIKLVERFAAVQKRARGDNPGDPAAELEEIHRQTQIVTTRIEAGAGPKTRDTLSTGKLTPPTSQPAGAVTEELDIQFTVNVEYTDVPVVGAKISVGDRSGITNSKGELTLQRTKQPHPLTVTAKGFKEFKGTLDPDLNGYGLHLDPIKGGGNSS